MLPLTVVDSISRVTASSFAPAFACASGTGEFQSLICSHLLFEVARANESEFTSTRDDGVAAGFVGGEALDGRGADGAVGR
ncbi:hypothetical protein HFX_0902 [Haloferax mediterranei ATCC 33500]|uniref:Uncharacterized protein n=1 Tax=Haloferax mediterranei (strain ATCC 33500 / DSM 1411 / JCM 8866 / NBRC 14739 / NCIMB 2177 / R-4) TaxID=523841 RepID=I3R314_HALMT|nr:hypothetical protein HFX_0902 [Haloferax mediterranei ATCC 33500]